MRLEDNTAAYHQGWLTFLIGCSIHTEVVQSGTHLSLHPDDGLRLLYTGEKSWLP